MILTHGANSLTMDYYVEIGGYKYPVVKIGNRLWMAENFKYHTTATFKYPNNSSDNEERYGLLYNLSGINEIKAMDLNGFRMPVYADGEALYNEFQSNVPALMDASSDVFGGIGTNTSGFKAVPSGTYNISGGFANFGIMQAFWTDTEIESERYNRVLIGANESYPSGFIGYDGHGDVNNNYFSIRLVKD